MNVLHLLSGGSVGGIEMLCRDIANLSTDRNEFCFLYSGGMIADEIEQKSVIYRYYLKNIFGRVLMLWNLVRKQKYDIIIVHHEGIGIYSFYLMLCQCFRRIKFIKYLHCSYDEDFFCTGNKLKDRLNYQILKKTLRRSNHLIAVSKFVQNSYQGEFRIDENKISVIYNGIPQEHICLEMNVINMKENHIRCLFIGRLVELKGLHILLQAIKKLQEMGTIIELEVLGDGPLRSEYESWVLKQGIENNIFFRGYELRKEMYFASTQIYICPSICEEAFGISIVEAQAAGLICVASRVGGIPEIILGGQDGFLFQKGDVDDLTHTLLEAIEMCKSPQCCDMQKAARQNSARFSIQQTVGKLHEICERIIEE